MPIAQQDQLSLSTNEWSFDLLLQIVQEICTLAEGPRKHSFSMPILQLGQIKYFRVLLMDRSGPASIMKIDVAKSTIFFEKSSNDCEIKAI